MAAPPSLLTTTSPVMAGCRRNRSGLQLIDTKPPRRRRDASGSLRATAASPATGSGKGGKIISSTVPNLTPEESIGRRKSATIKIAVPLQSGVDTVTLEMESPPPTILLPTAIVIPSALSHSPEVAAAKSRRITAVVVAANSRTPMDLIAPDLKLIWWPTVIIHDMMPTRVVVDAQRRHAVVSCVAVGGGRRLHGRHLLRRGWRRAADTRPSSPASRLAAGGGVTTEEGAGSRPCHRRRARMAVAYAYISPHPSVAAARSHPPPYHRSRLCDLSVRRPWEKNQHTPIPVMSKSRRLCCRPEVLCYLLYSIAAASLRSTDRREDF
ncbi:vacuolar ATP synthase subunit A [Striga asiatica]|uniref:Vacuolar ATP synthase subunit A n=1 Tax=Striga asiatica TaxID=4170 RepID=A0A5A7PRH2_STRAF|nr:vacuolar ATP synthase subunit A [Striga asiatica]